MYGRVYLADTYETCSDLPVDADSGVYYTPAVVPMYCNNDDEKGGWTMVMKTIGADTELTYTGDYIDSSDPMTKDPPIDSVSMEAEDALLWTYSNVTMDQFLFMWPDSDDYFMTGYLETPMTAQDYLSTYDTYQDDAPLTDEPTVVFGRKYFDGGVCRRSTALDCTVKYLGDDTEDNIIMKTPAPSPMFEPTMVANGYSAVGYKCNTLNTLDTDTDGGYLDTGTCLLYTSPSPRDRG